MQRKLAFHWPVAAIAAFALLPGAFGAAQARSLDRIRTSGAIILCAHPNSLPFASKTADPPGFQVETARALAKQLGVSLSEEWIVSPGQIFRAECDVVLDTIDNEAAMKEAGLKLSKPYYRGGVGLAVRKDSKIKSFADLGPSDKVGVMAGSIAAMQINQRHVPISTFAFEDEMVAALAAGEIDAAAVTPMTAGYYNVQHPDQPVVILPPDEAMPDLVWNVAIGLRRPDDDLRTAVNEAIDRMTADGEISEIYARYGTELHPPK